jgi:Divergent InlB B-repeat domain
MGARVLLPVGTIVAFALALVPAASASQCSPPYCQSYTLTVHRAGSGTGTVTSSPGGIACGTQCSAVYEQGKKITLTATPASGSTFAGWSGGGCAGAGACVVTLNSNTTVTATFDTGAPPPPPPPYPANNFSLKKVRHPKTGVVTIRVKVPGPGVIEARASKMKRVKARAKRAGTFTLRLTLTKQGMKILRQSKGRQLRLKVSFTFTPNGGLTRRKKKKLIFRVVNKGKKKAKSSAATVRFDEEEAAGAGGLAVVASTAKVDSKKAHIRVFCNGPQSCDGNLKLIVSGNVPMASSRFDLAAGVSKVLHMKLSGRAKKLLEGKHVPKARVAGTGLHPHAVKLKLAG